MAGSFVRRGLVAGILALSVFPATSVVSAAPPTGGDSQSPIDIRDGDVTFVDDLPEIRFRYPDTSLEVINTGSPDEEATVRAIVNTPATIRVEHTTYRLTQFHFHTPSEHLLNGEDFPLELHQVHQARNGDLLVIGVFFEIGDQHRELRRIFRDLPADATGRARSGTSTSTSSSPMTTTPTGTTDRSLPRRSAKVSGGSSSTNRWRCRSTSSPPSRRCSRTGTPASHSH